MDFRFLISFVSEWLGAIGVSWLLSLSARFQVPPIGFKYARREGVLSLSLFAVLLLFAFLYYYINPPVFSNPPRIGAGPVHDLGQALLLALLALAAFIGALVFRKQPGRSIGWNPPLLRPALQMGFAMGVLTIFLHNRVMDVLAGLANDRLTLLLFALGIAIAEETVFRGYLQMRLGWWLGVWPGIAVTALMFGLFHMAAWSSLPLETRGLLFGLTFVQGLVLGWVMHKSRHVVAPALYRTFAIWMTFFIV